MNVKKMTMIASYYSKFEIRFLMVVTVMLFAFLFAFSAARGASHQLADLTVIDETKSVWRTQSADGKGGFAACKWGLEGDLRVLADYDGDGTTDFAVYRRGTLYFLDSGSPRFRTVKFGKKDEVPQNSLSVKPSMLAVR